MMRKLKKVDEFRTEASNAIFTKQQALAVAFKLFELELADPANSEEDTRILSEAMKRVSFYYFDSTTTQTDAILDSIGVARMTSEDIINAINILIFEAE